MCNLFSVRVIDVVIFLVIYHIVKTDLIDIVEGCFVQTVGMSLLMYVYLGAQESVPCKRSVQL
jgi:hypothetical protein